MKREKILSLVFSIIVCEAAGAIGSLFTAPAIPLWYASLTKPAFNPPSWIFAPVWTALFALMGIALWLILEKRPFVRKNMIWAVGVFILQLALNILWSYFFFGQNDPGAAFVEIIFLWLAIAATIVIFYRIRRPAAYLLIPYLLWVSFAGFLNYSLWKLNASPEAQRPAITTSVPWGYSASEYAIEKYTGASCRTNAECETPGEYLLQSRCPFASACIGGRCAVVCPKSDR